MGWGEVGGGGWGGVRGGREVGERNPGPMWEPEIAEHNDDPPWLDRPAVTTTQDTSAHVPRDTDRQRCTVTVTVVWGLVN